VIRGGPGISGKRQPAAGRGGREVSSQSRVNREIIGDAATELSLATYQRGSPRSSATIARRDEITKRISSGSASCGHAAEQDGGERALDRDPSRHETDRRVSSASDAGRL